ncbi:MAG: general secretion pathway protein GspK [Gemmatimonadetes bacterium]|nr:general secretion pathway protein GspK [Gemmatimonadota bacterium]
MTRRGVALVLVLWIVVILGGLGATVLSSSRASAGVAANVRAAAVARYAAESGVVATVADIEAGLAAHGDSLSRADYLNALARTPRDSVALGTGRFAVAIADPTTQLDINAAPEERLAALLASFTDVARAASTARAIRRAIERAPATSGDGRLGAPDGALRFVTPIRHLESLRELPGVDVRALERAAPYLTVDGDGTVNRRAASDTVLRVAFGEARDEPSRLVVISRGWMSGSPLTHEVQAVYAISAGTLVLTHWRERVR